MSKNNIRHTSVAITTKTGVISMEKIGIGRFDLRDPYHLAVTLRWPVFFAAMLLVYVLVNFIFALIYAAQPGSIANARPGSLFDCFFFSVETLATVGYGVMAPATPFAHVVSGLETFVGLMLTATMTGLVFVRFSKPKAKILYADKAVVARVNGQPTLMVRLGNGRGNALLDATARLTTLVGQASADGRRFGRTYDLKLERADFPYFPLTWTLMHVLTPDSPLACLLDPNADSLEARLFLSFSARDPSLGAQVFDNHIYGKDDIAVGMRYVDAVTWDDAGSSTADMRKLSGIEPDTGY